MIGVEGILWYVLTGTRGGRNRVRIWMGESVPALGLQLMAGLHVLETLGLSFLVWTTWD